MQRLMCLLLFLGTLFFNVQGSAREPKILVLIIASYDLPLYEQLENIWKSYMHLDPEHVEAYFIRGNPDLPTRYEITDDVVWSKTQENVIPGVLNKTLLSFECMLPRLHEFDFIIRTNLSSFYIFPRLLEFVKTLPRKECYCAVPLTSCHGILFGHGCGMILSPDLVEMLVDNASTLTFEYYDDVAIGQFFNQRNIKLIPEPRMSINNFAVWLNKRDTIPANIFHFRVKTPNFRRHIDDVYIHMELLKMFYNISLN